MQVAVAGYVIIWPGSGLVWQTWQPIFRARCVLWLYGSGWVGAAGCKGLSGTSCGGYAGALCAGRFMALTSMTASTATSSARMGLGRTTAPPVHLCFPADHLFNAGAEILEHHHGRVAARGAGHGAARMRGGAGLIQAGNGHAVLRPAEHGTHGAGLRGVLPPAVRASVPEVRIHALDIQRAGEKARQNLVIRQVGRESPQVIQVGLVHLVLDFVPMLRALLQVVGLESDDFERVHARRRARRIGHAAADDL